MPTGLPVACSLTAAELPARHAEMAALGHVALLAAETSRRSATLRFRRGDQTRERLETIVAAESHCCAFLDMTLTDEHDALVLSITAPAGAEPVLQALVAAFSADGRAQ